MQHNVVDHHPQDANAIEVGRDNAVGWFEACTEHRGPDGDGPCDRCGWPAGDHTAGLAVVIEVARRTASPLRRAS